MIPLCWIGSLHFTMGFASVLCLAQTVVELAREQSLISVCCVFSVLCFQCVECHKVDT